MKKNVGDEIHVDCFNNSITLEMVEYVIFYCQLNILHATFRPTNRSATLRNLFVSVFSNIGVMFANLNSLGTILSNY